ncbi:CpXC domain-containing protein, partial [Halomicronema sp. CCY15110]|uniref:CpXC domain-containing protein n=1 Tax=Halomicronema sp. CCY15110 TaxID=2767773 RepID=UPI00195128EB
MGYSYAESVSLSCPSCRTEFAAQCWQIVDGVERPDLLKRIQRGKLHRMVCPDCGRVAATLDRPLLIYRPGQTPSLLFSPAEQTSREEDQAQAQALILRLRQGLGAAWQDDWLEPGLTGVPRPQLIQVLESGLPVAATTTAPQPTPPTNPLEELPAPLKELLMELAQSGVDLNSPEDLEKLLQSRPELRAAIMAAMGSRVSESAPSSGNTGDLQQILQELSQPVQDIRQMGRRVELCRQALTLVSHQGNKELWAALQGNLGNSLAQNPLGNRAQNIEQAITAYQQALTVRTQTAMPVEWATTMMNLANAYRNRIRGDKAANIEQAITAYQQALTVMT